MNTRATYRQSFDRMWVKKLALLLPDIRKFRCRTDGTHITFTKEPGISETFEKCQFLFKFKKGDNFNHPGTIWRTYPGTICRPVPAPTGSYGAGAAGRNTLRISRINPPEFDGGLKFKPVEAKRRSRLSGTQKLSKKGRFAKASIRLNRLSRSLKVLSGILVQIQIVICPCNCCIAIFRSTNHEGLRNIR